MRHNLGYRKLNRTSEHRKALFKNMLNSLIKYEQLITTLPKAKELKPKIDKVITIGKKNLLSNKKRLFSQLQNDDPMIRKPTIKMPKIKNSFYSELIEVFKTNKVSFFQLRLKKKSFKQKLII